MSRNRSEVVPDIEDEQFRNQTEEDESYSSSLSETNAALLC